MAMLRSSARFQAAFGLAKVADDEPRPAELEQASVPERGQARGLREDQGLAQEPDGLPRAAGLLREGAGEERQPAAGGAGHLRVRKRRLDLLLGLHQPARVVHMLRA
jgi:hypothetical protein